MLSPWRHLADRVTQAIVTQLDGLAFLERQQVALSQQARPLDLCTLERRILLNAVPAGAIDDANLPVDAGLPLFPESAAVATISLESQDRAEQEPESARELVVIERGIENFDELLSALQESGQAAASGEESSRDILVLDQDDSLATVSTALDGRERYDAVHLLVHGTERTVRFGGEWLLFGNASSDASRFASWQAGLTETADILFYSCDTAQTQEGRDWLESVSQATDADVAASTDNTGAEALGGDWTLEYERGGIETATLATTDSVEDWHGLLALFTVTTTADNTLTSLRAMIAAANLLPGTNTIEFSIGSGATTLTLDSELPTILGSVIIDATTQPGYAGTPLITLDGAGVTGNGLTLAGSGSTVKGLIISGFTGHGIVLGGSGGHTIQGNWIGTNSAGTGAYANTQDGIAIVDGSNGNTIGGTTATERNIIAGNGDDGISVRSASNSIYGNWIGLSASETALGNTGDGVSFEGAAGANTLGGAATGQGNRIASNGGRGVSLSDINTITGVSVRGNSIFANSGLGIDLGADSSTANDFGDADSGPNGRLNTPVLMDAVPGVSSTTIRGTYTGAANTAVTVDFYAASTVGSATNPQASVHLGSTSVTTNGYGVATFNASVSAVVGINQALTATATVSGTGTSEFAKSVAAAPAWNKLYWVDRSAMTLERGDLDGTDQQTLLSGLASSHAAAIDSRTGQIYYVDETPNRIRRVGLDGSGGTTIFTAASGVIGSLAIDSRNGHLFYTNIDSDTVGRMNLDGSGDTTIATLNAPNALTISEGLGYLFYSDGGSLYRSDLAGGGTMTLATGLGDVHSLAVDDVAGQLYFTDYNNDAVRRINIDGSGLTTLVSGEGRAAAITIDPRRDVMYWAVDQSNKIRTSTLSGSDAGHLFHSVPFGDDLFLVNLPGNGSAPTTTGLPNVSVTQGAGPTTVTLAGRFSDLESGPNGLVYTVPSLANPALYRAVFVDQASGTLWLDFDPLQFGSDTITVRATDGDGQFVDATFTVTVAPSNSAPTITSVADVTLPRNQSTAALAFTVGDVETAAGSLVVTATSSDQSKIGNSRIVLGGSGANRTVTVSSTPGAVLGPATITLTVSDGTTTAQTTFQVTVTLAAPTTTADSYTVAEDGSLNSAVGWWNTDWAHRQRLTFNNAAATETLTNFPVLVTLDVATFDYIRVKSNGDDLRFVDAGGNTLAYEIATWNSTGTSTIWVRVPTITAGSTTESITMYYGNSAAAVGSNGSAVWSNGYRAVYHLDDTGSTIRDSSSNGFNGTNFETTATAGRVGGARSFDGTNDRISLGTARPWLNNVTAATLSVLARPDTVSGHRSLMGFSIFTGDGNTASSSSRAELTLSGSSVRTYARGTDGGSSPTIQSGTAATTGAWQLFTTVINYQAGTVSQYRNGDLLGTVNVTFTAGKTPNTNSNSAFLGSQDDGGSWYFDGLMDEARLSTTARSQSWVRAEALTLTGSFVSYATAERVPGVLTNDGDPIGLDLTAVLVTGPTNGTLTLGANGNFLYTPTSNFFGTDSFTYRASNGTTASAPVTVTLNVTASNDAPSITSVANQTIAEDGTTAIQSFTVSDLDSPGSSLVVTATTSDGRVIPSENVRLTITGTGANSRSYDVQVSPAANQSGGPVTITLTVSDGSATAQSTFTVTVTPVNDAPTISSIANQTVSHSNPAGPWTVTIGDVDSPASALIVTATSSDQSLVANSAIAVVGTGATRSVSLRPNANVTGTATITLTVTDGAAQTSTAFTVTVTNTAPVAVPDTITVAEDSSPQTPAGWWNNDWQARSRLSFQNTVTTETLTNFPVLLRLDPSRIDYRLVQANGQDLRFVDSGGNALAYDIASWNPGGTSLVWVRVPSISSSSSSAIWMYYGNPLATAGESPSSVWTNGYSAVYHMDRAGTLLGDSTAGANEGTGAQGLAEIVGAVGLGRGFDGVNDTLELAGNRNYVNGAQRVTLSVWVTPDTLPTGQVDLIALSRNESPGTQRIDYSRTLLSLDSGGSITAGGRSTDTETFRRLATSAGVIVAGQWQQITAVIDYAGDTVSIYRNGVLVRTGAVAFDASALPNTNSNAAAVGGDEDLVDKKFAGALDEVRISRVGRSDSWIRADYLSQSDRFVTFGTTDIRPSVLSNDSDANGTSLRAVLVSGPSHAERFDLLANGIVRYTPTANFFGSDSFTYYATDGLVNSAPVTVTINVTSQPDPVLPNGILSSSVNEDAGQTSVDVVAGFTDPDLISGDTLRYVLVGNSNPSLFASIALDANTGQLLYRPGSDLSGTALVTVRATDSTGNTATNVVTISVTAVNDAPTISEIADQVISEDSSTGAIEFTVSDVDGRRRDVVITALSNDNTVVPDSAIEVRGSGARRTIRITPPPDAFGGPVTITLFASDGSASSQRTFTLTVTPVDDTPTLRLPPIIRIDEDTPDDITFSVGDLDTSLSSLVVSVTSNNQSIVSDANLVVTGTGSARILRITPALNAFGGPVELSFTVSDGATSLVQHSMLFVRAVNDPVQAVGLPAFTLLEDESGAMVDLRAGFSDVETPDSSLTYAVVGNTNPDLFASLPVMAGGLLDLNPAADAFGQTTLTIQATDAGGASSTTTLVLNVLPINDAPRFLNLSFTSTDVLSSVISGNIRGQLIDVEGQPITLRLKTGPVGGTLAFDPVSGAFTYTARSTYAALTDSFQIEATDSSGASTGTVTLNLPIRVAAPSSGAGGLAGGSSSGSTGGAGSSTSPGSSSGSTSGTNSGSNSGSSNSGSPATSSTTTSSATTTSTITTTSTAVVSATTTSVVPLAVTTAPGAILSTSVDQSKGTLPQSTTLVVGLQPTSLATSSSSVTTAKDHPTDSLIFMQVVGNSTGSGLIAATTRVSVDVEVRGATLREWALTKNRFTDDYNLSGLDALNLHYQTVQPLAQSKELYLQLEKVESDLSKSFKSEALIAGSTLAVTSGLSVGYVIWMIRGGLIMTSLLAQVPAWQDIDPLTVLDSRGRGEEDGESLQSLVDSVEDDEELTIA